jgi:S-adenosylmethionine:tRNA ribosyltransferase-isomerase
MNICDINIPDELIAQHPVHERDECRLLVLNKTTGKIEHKKFKEILSFFNKGDVLVLNDSKVVNARFDAHKNTGGAVELFLLRPASGIPTCWYSLVKGKNIKEGSILTIANTDIQINVTAKMEDGTYQISFPKNSDVDCIMNQHGKLPLPPYVKREPDSEDKEYYQTVFAKNPGSVASPTASLHFTPELLSKIKAKGVEIVFVTLNVGYGTFSIVRDIEHHIMHEETYSVPKTIEAVLNNCRNRGNKIWAVGTTVVRTLESAFNDELKLVNPNGATKLFIRPGYKFKVVDNLATNFHHPSTTLIHLVAAFAGENNICASYTEAVKERYRMLSYGDAMVIS